MRLYYPSGLFEPDVTTRYLKWWRNETDHQMENYPDVPPEHIAEETVHTSIDGYVVPPPGSIERSKASVVTETYTKITKGNMAMGNH